MFRILLLFSLVLLAWGLFLMVQGTPREKLFGSGLLVAIPAAWMVYLDTGRRAP